ncbi:protein kinase [Photobacterium aphoticum]|uniref:serine/threonine-protein kinase n=1 Tax=Photobacterium aphoticum TaxID=754436 RepID=UPI00069EC954|nr:serine/threonine-protein kinase [Photobacterium aphoticum]GHA54909.1 serine/threonine protein kinase [Photobacterium aphoticum]
MDRSNKSNEKQDVNETTSSNLTTPHDPSSDDKTLIQTASPQPAHTASSKPALTEGQVINGRYKIETLIGHGGMCDVYRATDLLLHRAGVNTPYVALKVLQQQHLAQQETANVLIREAQKTQKLSHPNIIRVYDFGVEKQAHYLVMEYIDGETLEEVILRSRPRGLSFQKAMSILEQVISALTYAHQQGVVHADLKPSNIMLTREGVIKIFDFGVSRGLKLNIDHYATDVQDETNIISGYTPTYASPALLQGEKPEIKDDIFAFSCMAYELLTSQHPFQRKPADEAEKAKLTASKPKHINGQQWRTLRAGLHFQANKRIASLPEFQQRLHKRRWPAFVSTAAVCALAGAMGYGYWFHTQQVIDFTAQIQTLEQEIRDDKALARLPLDNVVDTAFGLPADKVLIKEGLLRQRQAQLIAQYEEQVNAILNNREERYPDYYAIEEELTAAKALYPDSQQLTFLSESINHSWQSTIEMVEDRLHALLEKGKYYPQENGDDIPLLLSDLKSVRKNYVFVPTPKAEETFTQSFNTAIDQLDLAQIQHLLKVGGHVFTHSEHHKQLLDKGETLKSSIKAMEDYDEQRKAGKQAEFPYKAAELIYESKFQTFNETLQKLTTVPQLDSLSNSVQDMASDIPADFSLLTQIRLAMVTKYLDFADTFQSKGHRRSAARVKKKANDLLAKMNDAS